MDPASAIGTASAVLSFVSFASGLLAGAVTIYKNDSLVENATLEDVLGEMNVLSKNLRITRIDKKVSRHPHGETEKTSIEELNLQQKQRELQQTIENLCDIAEKVMKDLQTLLDGLKRRKGNKAKEMWSSVVASWKNVCREETRRTLISQLDSLKIQIIAAYAALTGTDIHNIQNMIQGVHDDMKAGHEKLKDEFLSELRKAADNINAAQHSYHEDEAYEIIFQSLIYEGMFARETRLKNDLHQIQDDPTGQRDAFSWIFSHNPGASDTVSDYIPSTEEAKIKASAQAQFHNWMSDKDTSVIHISGKPGAGKSTLMEFVYNHPETRQRLQEWANNSRRGTPDGSTDGPVLVMVKFYFSVVNGNDQQRQFDGLYRTLLLYILRRYPKAVKETLKDAWAQAMNGWPDGSEHFKRIALSPADISTAVKNIIMGRIPDLDDVCLCLFIDGLDEFEDKVLDTHDLVDELNRWTSNIDRSRVKICLASREEPPFIDRLARHATVRLHLLTHHDIQRYAEFRLRGIVSADIVTRTSRLISDRAEGVFLWVQLVLISLRAKIRGRPDWQRVLNIVERFPRGLSGMISSILQSIDKDDTVAAFQTYRIIKAAQKYNTDIGLLEWSFLTDYTRDTKFALHPDFAHAPADREEIEQREKNAGEDILSLFRGLFGVRASTVALLHRSIGEYIEANESRIFSPSDDAMPGASPMSNFDPYDAASTLILAQLRFKYGKDKPQQEGMAAADCTYLVDRKSCYVFQQYVGAVVRMRHEKHMDKDGDFAVLEILQSITGWAEIIKQPLTFNFMVNKVYRPFDYGRIGFGRASQRIGSYICAPVVGYIYSGLFDFPRAAIKRHPDRFLTISGHRGKRSLCSPIKASEVSDCFTFKEPKALTAFHIVLLDLLEYRVWLFTTNIPVEEGKWGQDFGLILECFLDAGLVTGFTISFKTTPVDNPGDSCCTYKDCGDEGAPIFEVECIYKHGHDSFPAGNWVQRCKNWTLFDFLEEFDPPNKDKLMKRLEDGGISSRSNPSRIGKDDKIGSWEHVEDAGEGGGSRANGEERVGVKSQAQAESVQERDPSRAPSRDSSRSPDRNESGSRQETESADGKADEMAGEKAEVEPKAGTETEMPGTIETTKGARDPRPAVASTVTITTTSAAVRQRDTLFLIIGVLVGIFASILLQWMLLSI